MLSNREKDVLRLLARGHDAKSAAASLGLSVHTVNDHLREARRKLGVTSSRAAARALSDAETGPPENLGRQSFGIASAASAMSEPGGTGRSGVVTSTQVVIGVLVMLVIILFAMLAARPSAPPSVAAGPTVVAVTPSPGSVIAPGPFTLSVTFDQPMQDRSYSLVQVSPETYPDCPGRPRLSRDGRTFTLRCTAQGGRHYEVWFNRQPYMNFRAQGGTPARPYRLVFTARAPAKR